MIILKRPALYLLVLCYFLILTQKQLIAQENKPDSSFRKYTTPDTLKDVYHVPDDINLVNEDVISNHVWKNKKNRNQGYAQRKDTTYIALTDSSQLFAFPYKGNVISNFGYRGRHKHTGVDIKLKKGDEVVSVFNGRVSMAKRYYGYGNMVVVENENGVETYYAHLSKITVKPNQIIKAGEVLGLGGRTGRATTDHLHFETRINGVPFNPLQILDFGLYSLKKDTLMVSSDLFQDFDKKNMKASKNKKNKKGKRKKYESEEIVMQSDSEKVSENQLPETVKSKKKNKKGKTKKADPEALVVNSDNENLSKLNEKHADEQVKSRTKIKNKSYVVKAGDTLFSIAKKNNVALAVLLKKNKMSKKSVIKLGQKIKIP